VPCYDSRSSPDYVRAEMQGRVDELARWLCNALNLLEELGFNTSDPELRTWWENHKRFDIDRILIEKRRLHESNT
jgi:hypothetical protein